MTLVVAFVFFTGIVMIGMTIVAINVWGPYMVEFKNFSDAFLAIFFLHMGLLNFEFMRYYNVVWSFGFVIIYSIFVIYILLSSFMTFFIDSYRRVTLQHGQPLQELNRWQGVHWKHDHFRSRYSFLRWFFGWLPDEFTKRLFKNFNDEKDEASQSE